MAECNCVKNGDGINKTCDICKQSFSLLSTNMIHVGDNNEHVCPECVLKVVDGILSRNPNIIPVML